MEYGEPCVMIPGMLLTLRLSAGSWDMHMKAIIFSQINVLEFMSFIIQMLLQDPLLSLDKELDQSVSMMLHVLAMKTLS